MKKFDRIEAVDYYIKGEYHCDKCPFCWGGEYMPGCDDYDDAGCYIFGDLRDTCRLIPPIRFILGWGRRKRTEYFRAHEYDDFSEWYAEKEKKETAFIQAFNDRIFSHFALFWKDKDGNIFGKPIDTERFCEFDNMMRFLSDCEDIFAPPSYVPLKKRWVQLVNDTWHKFIMIFKPYFCK